MRTPKIHVVLCLLAVCLVFAGVGLPGMAIARSGVGAVHPGSCQQKLAGYAEWSTELGAMIPGDGQVASVTVTNPFPTIISNPIVLSDFPAVITPKTARIVVVARQANGGAPDNYGTWIVVRAHNEQGGLRELPVADWQHVTGEWTAFKYELGEEFDWTNAWVSITVVSDLVSAAHVEVDALWIE